MLGLEKIFDFILDQIKNIIPIAVIHQYQGGCMYRFGKLIKELKPGWHFKFPYVNTYSIINIVDTTMLLPSISVITSDQKQLIVRGSIGYNIDNVINYFNNVYDAVNALSDRGCVIIREIALYLSAEEFKTLGCEDGILMGLLNKQIKEYGIYIQYFSLTTVAEGRSLRIYHESDVTENL